MTVLFDNKHLTIIGKRQNTGCDLCETHVDSADRHLCECLAYCRHKLLGNFVLKPGSIKALHTKDILNYICSTGRFPRKVRSVTKCTCK